MCVRPALAVLSTQWHPHLAEYATAGGATAAAAAPAVMCRWTDWVPTLGGRSVRPILDRMDYALTQVCHNIDQI
jgi:hypothetical protein